MPMGFDEEGHRELRKMQEAQEMRALIYYLSLFHRSSHIATALSASFLASVQLLTADQDQPLVFRFVYQSYRTQDCPIVVNPVQLLVHSRLALQEPPAERFPAYVRSSISGSAALTVTSAVESPINHLAQNPWPW